MLRTQVAGARVQNAADPECAYWNLQHSRNEEGVPLMTVVEWLRFIKARSQVDQDWMQAVMTRGWARCARGCSSVGSWLTSDTADLYDNWSPPSGVSMGHEAGPRDCKRR